MAKTILVLALIALLSPFTAAQFSQNFTSAQIGWGSRGVFAVPANVTDPDGTTYWVIERNTLDAPDGQWTLRLNNADGTNTNFVESNGDLVVNNQDGTQTSLASQLPPLLGITGGELLQVLENNIQSSVDSVYANPDWTNVTNADVNAGANAVVDQILATSSLPPFFLTPFRTQAFQQITDSLNNAQAVSAAINASLEANNTGDNGSNPNVGTTVTIPLNLTSFNLSSLEDVHQIWATYGNETVEVILDSEVAGNTEDEYSAWLVNLEYHQGAAALNDWDLQWQDNQGFVWNVQDVDGQIHVVGEDGSETNWTTEADWYVDNESGDLSAAIGNSVEDFVDAVVANAGTNNGTVVINVGPQGLNWTYPAEVNANA